MSEYFRVRQSQVQFFKTVPLYYQSNDGEFILYKKTGKELGSERTDQTRYPQLYFDGRDKEKALKELTKGLNIEFAKQVAEGGLVQIKKALGNIVREALTPGQASVMLALPETIDILFKNLDRDHSTMDYLSKISSASDMVIEHTVNVTALTLQYCFRMGLPDKEASNLALCALLHDVGTSTLDASLLETKKRLTDKQFKQYQAHSEAGHDMIILNSDFNIAVANVALEHHERLDKSGYPNGTNILCRESQLIGFIDCYEALTYHEKAFRKAKKPFDTLKLIKNEVIAGKFSPRIFKEFTSCLIR
ncbi:MAG: HD domain-containing protein [Desulfobacterales bacterium]|nr:HD domain-containing protein [Desulfobacterales bacterium]